MSKDLNQVVLIGNLTRDPELKYTASGVACCNLSIANNQDYTKDGQKVKQVSFFEIETWNKQAEIVEQFLFRGSKVCVSGTLKQQTWPDKETGKNRSKVVITSNNIQFLSGNNNTPAKSNLNTIDVNAGGAIPDVKKDDNLNDDIPF